MSTGAKKVTELTVRGILLGIAITVVFTAANVYIGLKVALTFATSIPAAVISMAVLSAFKNSSILENNIVQTVASAAGTLSAIIFVLPGLIIIGWWVDFPFWTSFGICAAGGVLGVLFTIPLRRAMVTTSDLPYPEGVAAAEVLQVGSKAREEKSADSNEGLLAVVWGAIGATVLSFVSYSRLGMLESDGTFKAGPGYSSYGMQFSLALIGAGYLVGLSVGVAMLVGVFIAFGVALPVLTAGVPFHGDIADFVESVRSHEVRYIGAGAIAVAAIWTLTKLTGPVIKGVISTMTAHKASKMAGGDTRDVDLSPFWIVILTVVALAFIGWLLQTFLAPTPLAAKTASLIWTALPFIFIGGFAVAAITGYMAGLIGASNSPLSGVGILAVIICATLFMAVAAPGGPGERKALVAFALFATAVVFSIGTISNNNLQDLKTGQLVGATPRAQQWALIIGVLAGAVVIPPVLNLLNQASGFAGAPGVISKNALGAPQANLIAALAQGVIEGNIPWNRIIEGGFVGVGLIVLDEVLGRLKWLRLPPLAVGMGIYLPMAVTLPVVIGAVIGHLFDMWANRSKSPEHAKRLAVLVASGMIVGESLFGVLYAGLIVAAQVGYIKVADPGSPIAVIGADFPWATAIAWGTFGALIALLYGWTIQRVKKAV